MKYKIAVWKGDGVGPELIGELPRILERLKDVTKGLEFKMLEFDVGYDHWKRTGSVVKMYGRTFGGITEETLEGIKEADAAIYVAVHASRFPQKEIDHPIPLIRRYLGLYANVLWAKSYKGISKVDSLDLMRVRELTEGMYHPPEFTLWGKYVCSLAIVSEEATKRIAKFAFDLAKTRNLRKVTCVEKKGAVPQFFEFFLSSIKQISQSYPDVHLETINMTNLPHDLITRPQDFDVVLTPNLYGGIIAGEIAALMGGLGLLPSGSFGEDIAVFRPQHGSAPDIAGLNIVNPIATVLATKMMLEYLSNKFNDSNCKEAARKLEQSTQKILESKSMLTRDLGGKAKTREVTDSIVQVIGTSE